jgi:septum formation protein
MLEAAGLDFAIESPELDEHSIKAEHRKPVEIAARLAEEKAVAVSRGRPGDWVVGSDSVVSVDGRLFSKPADRDEAAEHLRAFSGQQMVLTSAVALARSGAPDWSHAETARLQVRELSAEFISAYLEAEWPEVGYTVGVFRLEGRGVQLFERIEGDHFTILGMPLIPLLAALRERGLLLA